jgi:hypothetical protein
MITFDFPPSGHAVFPSRTGQNLSIPKKSYYRTHPDRPEPTLHRSVPHSALTSGSISYQSPIHPLVRVQRSPTLAQRSQALGTTPTDTLCHLERKFKA